QRVDGWFAVRRVVRHNLRRLSGDDDRLLPGHAVRPAAAVGGFGLGYRESVWGVVPWVRRRGVPGRLVGVPVRPQNGARLRVRLTLPASRQSCYTRSG